MKEELRIGDFGLRIEELGASWCVGCVLFTLPFSPL
jgi:hypothetical protein